MKELEKIFKGLANKRRLTILKYLKTRGEANVGDVAREIKLSFKATSRHLAVLHNCDILEKEQRNVQMFYRIAVPHPPIVKHTLLLL